ncbi:MAG TPA: serine hydrolase domain-containing protein, partial [Chloroflexota bacterium]|nr:serine hydrolase domain-containing protein [Chloroflexota bacterium]
MANNAIPGGSVAIYRGGTLIYTQQYGWANQAEHLKVRPRSLFRIASISKPITAVTILKLHEEGRVDLHAQVLGPGGILRRLRPPRGMTMDPQVSKITVMHLLQHTAGWNATAFDPMFAPAMIAAAMGVPSPPSPETIIRYMLGQPLQTAPGTAYSYSNFGYCLLGRVIEAISGARYADYVRTATLRPMGIIHARQGHTRLQQAAPDEVHYYADDMMAASVFPGQGLVPAPYGSFYLEAMDANAGWIFSAGDLARFIQAIAGPGEHPFLRRQTIQKMLAPPPAPVGRTGTGDDWWYGMGWRVMNDAESNHNWYHLGGLSGTSGFLGRTANAADLSCAA